MSSILTNNSAMVALQTLNSINKNLAMVQGEISTGKSIASAKDNAAVWAISKVMESDVEGFKAISDSLSLGQSTVAVGRNAAESVTDLLTEVKAKIVAAQEDNVDRGKLQTDLDSLREQISGIVGAAQFNGQNLLSNSEKTAGTGSVDVLASLDRAADGSVSSSNITIGKSDLGTTAAAAGNGADVTAAKTVNTTAITDGSTGDVADIVEAEVVVGQSYTLDTAKFGGTGSDAVYVARDGDTGSDVAQALADMANFRLAQDGIASSSVSFSADGNTLQVTNNSGADFAALAAADLVSSADGAGAAANTIGGGLAMLGEFDISTEAGANAALVGIEGLTNYAIDAASEFGTGEKRLEIQNDFVSKLMDNLTSGIGALVDANMEEASAKLQALQVQQQLGVQSLSIANQAPQTLLSLFR
jgi:flagellin